jgi:hypothetical protein
LSRSSPRRLASTQPADPAPMMMMSKSCTARSPFGVSYSGFMLRLQC